jgi:hypothetical protein
MNKTGIKQDSLWKGIIEDLFEDFLLYFYPEWAKTTLLKTVKIWAMGIEEAIRQEILEIGETKGKKEVVFGMFEEGLSVEAIVRITKLPLSTIEEWKKKWEKR